MKYARLINGVVSRICPGNPAELYHPDVAALYDTEIPDDIVSGATLIDGTWTNPVIVEPTPAEPVVTYPKLSPLSFKMCFTAQERIAIKALKSSNPVIADAFDILDDPRLTNVDLGLQSNRDLIDYLVSLTVLTSERATAVKAGVLL